MQSRWGIAHKGLVLISVPLVFELAFLSTIGSVLSQAQSELDRVSRSRQVVSLANDAGRILIKLSTVATGLTVAPNPRIEERYKQLRCTLDEEFDALNQLLQDKPREQESLNAMRKQTDSILADIDGLRQGNRPCSLQVLLNSKLARRVGDKTDKIGHALLKLVFDEALTADQGTDRRKALMQRLQLTLAGGFVFNSVITVALAMYFWRGISARLRWVMGNARLLAARAPLSEPLTGSDEIAELDAVFHDATTQLESLESARRRLTAAIAQRLEAPLNQVQQTTAAFQTGKFGAIDERTNERLESAQRSTERLLRLIAELRVLEHANRDPMDLQLQNISAALLIKSAASTVQELADQRSVKININPTDTTLAVDRDRMTQVLVNLLSNAIKFSPPNSSITVDVVEQPSHVEISVLDSGSGIPPELQVKVFELFEQVDTRDATDKGGSGLGLAICKNIVDRHQGSITIDSKPGEGAKFIVRIPVAEARITQGAMEASAS